MNTERAREIFQSAENIPVHLDGVPVWIEEVDEANGMATVQIESDPLNTRTVSVERLEERQ
jgi:small acid-soluble spore protein H (minor)